MPDGRDIHNFVFFSAPVLNAHFEIMFLTQEFLSLILLILPVLVMLYYVIKMYRAVLQLGMNHQQPLTEARNRSNRERINGRADPHIRYPTEHDERQG